MVRLLSEVFNARTLLGVLSGVLTYSLLCICFLLFGGYHFLFVLPLNYTEYDLYFPKGTGRTSSVKIVGILTEI